MHNPGGAGAARHSAARPGDWPGSGLSRSAATSDTRGRTWYGHDVLRWPEFRRRYREELDANPDAWHPILDTARKRKVTLLYSARDVEHNSALVLRDYLTERIRRRGSR